MIDNNERDNQPVSETQEGEVSSSVKRLKVSKRDEFLAKLTSLFTMAYREGSKNQPDDRVRQRWFTIAGYLGQVAARVVTDLEYEQLRTEVEEMKRRIQASDVIRPRRTTYAGRAWYNRKITRKPNTRSYTNRPG